MMFTYYNCHQFVPGAIVTFKNSVWISSEQEYGKAIYYLNNKKDKKATSSINDKPFLGNGVL